MKITGFMRKVVWGWTLRVCLPLAAHAAATGVVWDKAPNQINNPAALQNGAKLFVNYCLNCHSAAFMRYNRLQDIGLSLAQIKDNFLPADAKLGDTMKAAIDPQEAKAWFGVNPPDLSLIARSRSGAGGSGADYLYTYMRTFYRDAEKPTGWNNLAFPNVAMPHALWQLQGERQPIYEVSRVHGQETHTLKGWQQTKPGLLTPLEYDQAVADLVNYLRWMGEPAQNTRVRVGVWVLLFLGVFSFFAWRLSAAYWKDVR